MDEDLRNALKDALGKAAAASDDDEDVSSKKFKAEAVIVKKNIFHWNKCLRHLNSLHLHVYYL